MPRPSAFAVLIVPYAVGLDGAMSFALFRGADQEGGWHALRGEPRRGETALGAARREAARLAGVPQDAAYLPLDTRAAIELPDIACPVVEYAFGVRVCDDEVRCAEDRYEHRWFAYELADGLLQSTADRNALWELRRRLGRPAPCY